ncbi:MAG: hypothetical protein KDC09_05360 [Bacteroidales bacterium]|nr:hypothetical protein [Bacteroidales bacterium]
MVKLQKIGQLTNTLSLDVVVGAILSAAFASRIFSVTPGVAYWFILPIAVWVVYTSDHLVDAYRLKEKAHTPRHLFHHQNFRLLARLVFVLSLVNIILAIFFLEHIIIVFGFIVGGGTLLYLSAVHFIGKRKKVYLQKELFVAVIYVSGVWGGPWALSGFNISPDAVILFAVFMMLAIADVLVFTIYDHNTDQLDKHPTLFSHIGEKAIYIFYYLLIVLSSVGVIYLIIDSPVFLHRAAAKIYLIMCLLLLLLISIPDVFNKNARYRTLGEMVFWLPGIILLIGDDLN